MPRPYSKAKANDFANAKATHFGPNAKAKD